MNTEYELVMTITLYTALLKYQAFKYCLQVLSCSPVIIRGKHFLSHLEKGHRTVERADVFRYSAGLQGRLGPNSAGWLSTTPLLTGVRAVLSLFLSRLRHRVMSQVFQAHSLIHEEPVFCTGDSSADQR